jgi:hypothetical protein
MNDRKSLIGKDFSNCPPNLWITLCANWADARQVLDSVDVGLRCPFWRQGFDIIQIKDLASIQMNRHGPAHDQIRVAAQQGFWG